MSSLPNIKILNAEMWVAFKQKCTIATPASRDWKPPTQRLWYKTYVLRNHWCENGVYLWWWRAKSHKAGQQHQAECISFAVRHPSACTIASNCLILPRPEKKLTSDFTNKLLRNKSLYQTEGYETRQHLTRSQTNFVKLNWFVTNSFYMMNSS